MIGKEFGVKSFLTAIDLGQVVLSVAILSQCLANSPVTAIVLFWFHLRWPSEHCYYVACIGVFTSNSGPVSTLLNPWKTTGFSLYSKRSLSSTAYTTHLHSDSIII